MALDSDWLEENVRIHSVKYISVQLQDCIWRVNIIFL